MDRRSFLTTFWRGDGLRPPTEIGDAWPRRWQVRLTYTRLVGGLVIGVGISVVLAIFDVGRTRQPTFLVPLMACFWIDQLGDKLGGKRIPAPDGSELSRKTQAVEWVWIAVLAAPLVAGEIGGRGVWGTWSAVWAVIAIVAVLIRPATTWTDYVSAARRTAERKRSPSSVAPMGAVMVVVVVGLIGLGLLELLVQDVYRLHGFDRWMYPGLGAALLGLLVYSMLEERGRHRRRTSERVE